MAFCDVCFEIFTPTATHGVEKVCEMVPFLAFEGAYEISIEIKQRIACDKSLAAMNHKTGVKIFSIRIGT